MNNKTANIIFFLILLKVDPLAFQQMFYTRLVFIISLANLSKTSRSSSLLHPNRTLFFIQAGGSEVPAHGYSSGFYSLLHI